jgi:anti-anti-sigma factor
MLGNITHYEKDGISYIKISGELDSRVISNFQNIFEELLKIGKNRIVLDLSECTFIYSVGIGKIVYFMKKLENIPNSYFKVKNPSPRIRKLFELVKLSDILE